MSTQVATEPQKLDSNKKYSVAEYIAFEEQALERHEFTNGKLTAMAGTSRKHNKICLLITFLLMQQIKDCEVFMENLKVELYKSKRYVYPDIVVTCDPSDTNSEYIITKPKLIVEVTSKSTRIYDKGDKFRAYQKLKSLNHYILVDQHVCLVEYFFKDEKGKWQMEIFTKKSDIITLKNMDVSLPVSKIYP